MRRLWAIARRHEPRVWLVWAVGLVLLVLTPLALADPAIWVFVADPELLALVGVTGIALLRVSAGGLVGRTAACGVMLHSRAAVLGRGDGDPGRAAARELDQDRRNG